MVSWYWLLLCTLGGALLGAAVTIFLAALSGSKNEFFHWTNGDNDDI